MADLPALPVPHAELAKYIAQHPEKRMTDIMEPYRKYEATLRNVYAQDRQNPLLNDHHLNVLPLFTEDTKNITTRARNLDNEPEEEKSRYVMPLPEDKRRPDGSPATVADLSEFQKNLNIFSESSLVDMDWSNVVAAGSSVVNCLLPVPKEFTQTKKKLREYYHEKFCPASDVDLFLYGLTHEQAIEKIKQIERAIRDAILNEVTVVRTKYAITIASQYPVRHIQIVLRVYKSVSEILTGFDIDAAGGAYDGKQVYVTPRALGSFITQINHIDLSRRSPSYENRLSKYSHRNFEVYWPDLDRSRVDPTIFERNFKRTLGLARLLVLERLPTTSARETYLNKRREERGRPRVRRDERTLMGNIKDYHEDEVADWLSEEDVSNYHTFTIPYGQKFHAKRVEKLCYTRDLLLNAEWNQPDERAVYLHRHPAFFGRVEDVIEDCCGCCPVPKTPEEIETAEKEAEIYISGKVSFLIDDPGRQQIGSFNPLTEQDWTDMAYVGNNARLCQSIVDGDNDDVLNWLGQEGADPNKRDYTGRSPLHLAVMTSTPEVVKSLVAHGSRLTARLADGTTALHLAASRGAADIVRILMEKSIENEEVEEERQDRRRKAMKSPKTDTARSAQRKDASDKSMDDSDGELIDDETTETVDTASMATGSFVDVKKEDEQDDDLVPDESEEEPDYFKIDVLAWDTPCSPLHLAIIKGHEEVVKLLCDYGADSILPLKYSSGAAILTLVLALALPREKAKSMAKLLLKLGATSSQSDAEGCTVFHRFVFNGDVDLVETLLEDDKMGAKMAINHMICGSSSWDPYTTAPLHNAVQSGDLTLVLKLLNAGAQAHIDLETWLKAAKVSQSKRLGTLEENQRMFGEFLEQPLISAIRCEDPQVAIALLENGADPNTFTSDTNSMIANEYRRSWTKGESALDLVRRLIKKLRTYTGEKTKFSMPPETLGMDECLDSIQTGTYRHWAVSEDIKGVKKFYNERRKAYDAELKRIQELKGAPEKTEAINEAIRGLEEVEREILSRGGKIFAELRPDIKDASGRNSRRETPNDSEPKTYKANFSIRNDSEVTEKRVDGYVELFEAAWKGEIDRIKSLTLQAWGPDKDQPPLKMDVTDQMSNSPFSLAFLRGHHEAAHAILEIIKAQWSAPEEDKVRFKLHTRNEEYESDEYDSYEDNSDESEGSEPRIVSEKVDKAFTIENIGQVSMQVKSHTKPLEVICARAPGFVVEGNKVVYKGGSRSLFVHLLDTDDATGLKTLLEWAQIYAGEKFDGDDDDSSRSFTFPQNDFHWAIEHGKTRLLAQIIKRTGAGIPLDDLVKKSGVEIKQKPRYYQGLTVYGKKRKDWATAGRNMVVRTTGSKTAPLLYAALSGSMDSVEFFLGDAPHRHYNEFSKSKAGREESRLKHLKESPGGFDRAISKWLGADNDLVIHCAVLAAPCPSANELLEYLVDACPAAMEKKNSQGDTPLTVACRMGRIGFVKILIAANADQSVRNLASENIIHAALTRFPKAEQLRGLLDLLDADLRSHLFLQRKSLYENGTTPLHMWISQICGQGDGFAPYYARGFSGDTREGGELKETADMLRLLLKYSKGAELEMLNGAGDTCLHTAIMYEQVALVKVLVDFRPSLLYRESAIGRTPAELAHDRMIRQALQEPPNTRTAYPVLEDMVDKPPQKFVRETRLEGKSPEQYKEMLHDVGLSDEYDAEVMRKMFVSMGLEAWEGDELWSDAKIKVIWDLCHTAMEKHPDRRRLVSLNEANDVARRLGEKYSASRYFSIQARDEDSDAGEKDDEPKVDFATQQMKARTHEAWRLKCSSCGNFH